MRYLIIGLVTLFMSLGFYSCKSDDEEVRKPADIEGVWSPKDNVYLNFCPDNTVHRLVVEYQDGESIGVWSRDVYFYEPGYNLVIYISAESEADVYEIVELTPSRLVWCWVDEMEVHTDSSIGEVVGEIIKKAQEGFTLNPELYETFDKISENQYLSILESLDLQDPWEP